MVFGSKYHSKKDKYQKNLNWWREKVEGLLNGLLDSRRRYINDDFDRIAAHSSTIFSKHQRQDLDRELKELERSIENLSDHMKKLKHAIKEYDKFKEKLQKN